MAFLRNTQTGGQQYLNSHHTFGRKQSAVDTQLSNTLVSKIHAVISWGESCWYIKDLSRNGTWLDGKKLAGSEPVELSIGQKIQFADPLTNCWLVEELSPPSDMLIGLNLVSDTRPLLDGYHLLPDGKNPLAALLFCPDRQQWILERLDEDEQLESQESTIELPIESDQEIKLGQYGWSLFQISRDIPTEQLDCHEFAVEDCLFEFHVSLDEEHVQLFIEHNHKRVDLQERSHHYLLLYMARTHWQEAQQGVDENDKGWVRADVLEHDIGIEMTHINILIYRARKQMIDAFPNMPGLVKLLERRRGCVRFNCPQAIVIKGGQSEKLL